VDYVRGQLYYGIKTGFNNAFVIDGAKRADLIERDARSAEIIKPLLVGKDVHKWSANQRDRWLIVTPIGIDMKHYPVVFAHLKQWQTELEKRWDKGNHWWELRPCDYYNAFSQPKIVFPDIAARPRFALDTTSALVDTTGFIMPCDDLIPTWRFEFEHR